jgi:hypothetical protein
LGVGGRQEGVMAAPPTRQRVVDAAVAVLREHRGTATVAATVMGVYRADARFKDYVKDELGTTVLDLLQQHPEHFALDASKSLVALATGEDSAHVYTMEEVAPQPQGGRVDRGQRGRVRHHRVCTDTLGLEQRGQELDHHRNHERPRQRLHHRL